MQENHYKRVIEKADFGYCYCKICDDIHADCEDFTFLEVNEKFEKISGLDKDSLLGKKFSDLFRGIFSNAGDLLTSFTETAIQTGKKQIQVFSPGFQKWFRVEIISPEKYYFSAFFYEEKNSLVNKGPDLSDSENRQNENDNLFINRLSFHLTELPSGTDIIPAILQDVLDYTSSTVAVFSLYDNKEKSLIIKHIETDGILLTAVVKVVGDKILETKSPVNEEVYERIVNEKIGVAKSLTEVSFGAIPATVDSLVRGMTGLDKFYGIAHIMDGKLYGTTMLAFKKDIAVPSLHFLQSYAYLITLALRRNIAEKALLLSEERFRNMTNLLPQTVFEANLKGELTFVNKKAFEHFGYTQEDFLKGVNCIQMIVAADRERALKNITNFSNQINSTMNEYLALRKDGTTFPVLIFSSPIITNNTPAGLRGIIIDISERKKAEEEIASIQAKYRHIIENSPIGIFQKYLYGGFIYINDEVTKQFHCSSSEEFFEISEELFSKGVVEGKQEEFRQFLVAEGKVLDFEAEIRLPDGYKKWFSISAFREENGDIINGFCIDITERKYVQTLIDKKNKELEQVIYITSHDLRSPLVNVEGFSSEIEYSIKELEFLNKGDILSGENITAKLEEILPDMKECIKHVKTSVKQMDSLLTGLLKLSRTGRMPINLKLLDMEEIINKVLSGMEYQLNNINVNIELKNIPPCASDEVQVTQILTNLIGNAVKYSSPDRINKITISGKMESVKTVYCIEDTGIGIQPADQEKIFEIFSRLNPGNTEGEGLGLTIVKQILDRLEGEIWVDSEYGKGSRFYFALPSKLP